jgi:hypothetical protein
MDSQLLLGASAVGRKGMFEGLALGATDIAMLVSGWGVFHLVAFIVSPLYSKAIFLFILFLNLFIVKEDMKEKFKIWNFPLMKKQGVA